MLPEEEWDWGDDLPEEEKAERRKRYAAALTRRQEYEQSLQVWRESEEYREAPKKLVGTVRDLERRGLLQYDHHEQHYDLHPVVRSVAAGGMKEDEKERYGRRVVDYFSAQPHSPYKHAQTLEELSSGLHVIRTLIKLGQFEQAAFACTTNLVVALLNNLEAYDVVLSLLRPFFTSGWGELPKGVLGYPVAFLSNTAANALMGSCDFQEALGAYEVGLRSALSMEYEDGIVSILQNMTQVLSDQNQVANTIRVNLIQRDFAVLAQLKQNIFIGQLDLFCIQSMIGQWDSAAKTWGLLDSMGRNWSRNAYRQGDAEFDFAHCQFWQGKLQEEHLTTASKLAKADNNRLVFRELHRLRGSWRMEFDDWKQATASFHDAVRLARERRLVDAESETGLALAKYQLGQFTDDEARREAERLAELRHPAFRYLALLWRAIGDIDQAKEYALKAYRWAWADGEPYVFRYELTKSEELLKEMNVPIPIFPPYDPEADKPFPWEAEVRALIEKIRATKEAANNQA